MVIASGVVALAVLGMSVLSSVVRLRLFRRLRFVLLLVVVASELGCGWGETWTLAGPSRLTGMMTIFLPPLEKTTGRQRIFDFQLG